MWIRAAKPRLVSFAGLMLLNVSPCLAAPPVEPKSVDEQLLEEDPATTKPAPKAADTPPRSESADHPLSKLAEQMRQSQELLSQRRSDALTQHKQQQIADALAALLKQAQQSQRKQSKPGAAQQSQSKSKEAGGQTGATGATGENPKADESVERHGSAKTARPEVAELRSAIKDRWGHLPNNVYEEVVQAARGRFLTQYEQEIEKYFQRLLEQRDGAKR